MLASKPFSSSIRHFRLYVSWSQREFAEAIPVNLRTLQRWEQGETTSIMPVVRRRIGELMTEHGYVDHVWKRKAS